MGKKLSDKKCKVRKSDIMQLSFEAENVEVISDKINHIKY